MFGRKIRLFNLFGFEVGIDMSWFILAVLITWSLAKGYFPHYYKDISDTGYWLMGAAGALGLFFSIVFHEMSHSLVARKYGLPMKGITLFIFGGVAQMDREPDDPKSEFLMAIAGPVSSYILAVIFYFVSTMSQNVGWPEPAYAIFSYLAFINVLLATFNLIPGFPLDGGRMLRAALWYWKDNQRWATRLASDIGSGFGVVLILLGLFSILTGNFIGGIWWALIGFFLKNASGMSYRQMTIRKALEGENVADFMKPDPITVPPSATLRELVEEYFYKFHYKMFPVVQDSELRGFITTRHVKSFPQQKWDYVTVGDAMESCSDDNTIKINDDAITALSTMNRTGNSRLMVIFNGKLAGIITLKDMMKFLSIKVDLESDETVEANI